MGQSPSALGQRRDQLAIQPALAILAAPGILGRQLEEEPAVNIADAIRARRTVHNYTSQPVAEDLLQQGLELALLAPNHRLTFPWDFLIAGPKTRLQLAAFALQLKDPDNALPTAERHKLQDRLNQNYQNPSLVVAGLKRSTDSYQAREDYATIACSLQNACLFYAAAGLGSKWSSGAITSHPHTYEILGIDRNAIEIVGFLWVGYPEGPVPPRRRPPLTELLKTRP